MTDLVQSLSIALIGLALIIHMRTGRG